MMVKVLLSLYCAFALTHALPVDPVDADKHQQPVAPPPSQVGAFAGGFQPQYAPAAVAQPQPVGFQQIGQPGPGEGSLQGGDLATEGEGAPGEGGKDLDTANTFGWGFGYRPYYGGWGGGWRRGWGGYGGYGGWGGYGRGYGGYGGWGGGYGGYGGWGNRYYW